MKINSSKAIAFLCVFLSAPAFSQATRSIQITDSEKFIDLLEGLSVIHTPVELTPAEALEKIQLEGFAVRKSSVGFNQDNYWITVTVENGSGQAEDFILEIKNPQIDYLKIYRYDSARITPIATTGDQFHFSQRVIWNRNFAFPVVLQKGEQQSFLIEIKKKNSSLSFPMALWHANQFYDRVYLENLGYGLYFGFILLCIIYSFLTFIFLRKQTYFWYGIWGITTALLIFSALGFSHQFLYPDAEDFNGIFRTLIQKLNALSFLVFSSLFLNMKEFTPRTYKVVMASAIGYGVVLIPLPFRPAFYMDYSHIIIPALYVVAIALILLILISCWVSFQKQKATVLYYVIAFSALFAGSVIMIFQEFGIIDPDAFLINPYMFGSSIEMLILSLGITYQIKKVYDERNQLSLKFAQQQKELLKAYVNGVEKERERISRELHDDIGSRLSTLNRFIGKGENTNEKLQEQIEILCEDVRDMSHRLAPATLKITGLKHKISELITSIQTDNNIQTDVQFYDFPDEIDNETSTHLYRILQEAFHNITKHAQASLVDLQFFGYEDELVITIEDNGKGFKQQNSPGIGLQNMQARAASLNGTLEVNSQPGQGTQIMLRIPVLNTTPLPAKDKLS